ncbi:MAG: response regulator [Candidatus Omnitrophota bacterium]|jgi:DNA-binding response OmpR family regulator|nr:response regulator [Candidatus Omnitrophota bacterium]MDD5138483.1 response regulator [Candidatus Omnitrophota bacterium]MDD5538672.1 response regulator [Candidatus Omnitrophota bacterium]
MFTGGKTVLIVDDDPSIVRALKAILERHGCRTCVAMDGREALQKIDEKKPDLIILDLWLPEIPGEMVCKVIKRNEKFKDIPVIMVTAKCTEVDRIIGRVIGADYYVNKPFDAMALLKLVQDALGINDHNVIPH